MRTPNKFQLAAIAAASVLVAYFAVTAGMQKTNDMHVLDIPPILLAEGAAVDYFLEIEGVEGESTSEEHKGQIEIISFSWGMSNSGSMPL
jgi:hypothetical protein